MSLELRPVCERCGAPLAVDGEAFICSYECTFCAACTQELEAICPNCSGELVRRPRSPVRVLRQPEALDRVPEQGVGEEVGAFVPRVHADDATRPPLPSLSGG